jgi:hypothetical protein
MTKHWGAGPSFPNKISNPAAAPSLSLRFLQGQGGAPSRIKMKERLGQLPIQLFE